MGAIKVPTNFNIELEFEIPEFYRRMLATLFDYILLFFYMRIASAIFYAIIRNSDFSMDSMYDLGAWQLILQLPVLLYFPLMEITLNGQSVGKKIMGLRVVNENGGRPAISQYIIRWLTRDIWFVFLLSATGGAGSGNNEALFLLVMILIYFIVEIILVVSTKKSQRLGDMLAHTIIIRTNQQRDIEETVFQEVADSYTPSFPSIMQLSDKDINAIKSILETARRRGDFDMAANASEKIKTHLKIDSSMSPFDFLDTLLKDYNYLSAK